MTKLIFWDWSGTLVDESRLDRRVCRRLELEISKQAGIPVSEARGVFAKHLKNLEGRWEWHDYTHHAQRFGLDWSTSQTASLHRLRIIPFARQILEISKRKGYLNILTTNAVSPVVKLRAEKVELLHLFDGVIASDLVLALKSEGKHYLSGLMKWRGDAGQSMSIGNNPTQDIRPAAALGLRTVLCEFGRMLTHFHSAHLADEKCEVSAPGHRIGRLEEIQDLF